MYCAGKNEICIENGLHRFCFQPLKLIGMPASSAAHNDGAMRYVILVGEEINVAPAYGRHRDGASWQPPCRLGGA